MRKPIWTACTSAARFVFQWQSSLLPPQLTAVQALSKFAMLIYTVHTLAKNPKLAQEGLAKLKKAFAVFAQNKQKNALVYESKSLRGWIFQEQAMLTPSSGLEGSCVRSGLRHWRSLCGLWE